MEVIYHIHTLQILSRPEGESKKFLKRVSEDNSKTSHSTQHITATKDSQQTGRVVNENFSLFLLSFLIPFLLLASIRSPGSFSL